MEIPKIRQIMHLFIVLLLAHEKKDPGYRSAIM